MKNKNCSKCIYAIPKTLIGADCIYDAIRFNSPAIAKQKIKNKDGDCKDFQKKTLWMKLTNWFNIIFKRDIFSIIIGCILGIIIALIINKVFK